MAGLLDFIKTPRSDNPNRKASLADRSQIYNLLDNIIGFNDDRVTPGEALGAGLRNDPMGLLGSMAQGINNDMRGLMFEGQAMQRPQDVLGYAAAPMAPGAAGLMKNTPNVTNAIRAYQGTPHNFSAERLVRMPDGSTQYVVGKPDILPDIPPGSELVQDYPLGRMRMDKMGTGEGAQAYGHGLYLAENEGIARHYRDALSGNRYGDKRVFKLDGKELPNPTRAQHLVGRRGGDTNANVDHVLGFLGKQLNEAQENMRNLPPLSLGDDLSDLDIDVMRALSEVDDLRADIAEVEGLRGRRMEVQQPGSMYEVNINANPEDFLDYDAPLSGQPAWQNIRNRWDETLGDPDIIQERLGVDPEKTKGGQYLYKLGAGVPGNDVGISNQLREAGIPGIRFRDAGSRGMDGAEGSRNYVMFDENLINIVRKYGIAGAATMLGISALDVEQAMAQGSPQRQGLLAQGAR